jgi:tetrahydromethanopterin S-methyltransferase subunit C
MSVGPDGIDAMPPRSERSLAGLFGDLARESSSLLRLELALARAELEAKLSQFGTGALEMAVGGLLIYAGFLALLVGLGLALALALQPWLAAVAVGAVTVIVGAVIAVMGKRKVGSGAFIPERTLRSLRKDTAWARRQMQ